MCIRDSFIEYNENVATIYDLRFPRILIAIFGGAATAVSGVLLQAVMKNPLADPGIIGVSSGASLTAVLITAFVPTLYFFTPLFAFIGGMIAFLLVYSLSWKGGLSPCLLYTSNNQDAGVTQVTAAVNELTDAMEGLTARANLSSLNQLLDEVGELQESAYTDCLLYTSSGSSAKPVCACINLPIRAAAWGSTMEANRASLLEK